MTTTRTLPQNHWLHEPRPEQEPDGGSLASGLHPVLRALLAKRGIREDGEVEAYLNPRLRDLSDPFLLPEMDLAVERIFRAMDSGEEVCILGDYDVDGITSVTLLKTALAAYGLEARPFIPIRGSEGYGLSEQALERCMREGAKPELLITVDCGTVSHEAIAGLRAQGVDVVVVDHHEPGPDGRPPCNALVNPKFTPTGLEYLCAAGVVFKLVHAMLKRRPLESLPLKDNLDLVALATISDIVPLEGENRTLVRHGLRRLSETSRPGLRALMQLTGLEDSPRSSDVGFRIGPRINAAGRMDKPKDALDALLATDSDEAYESAMRLDEYNRQRQKTEQMIVGQALEMLQQDFKPKRDPVIVLGSREWHPGVVGIVASRLSRMFHRPAFVIAIDGKGHGKGSGRSVEGISLVEAIAFAQETLEAGGGHHMAAGINILESQIAAFRERFAQFVAQTTDPEKLRPTMRVDAELSLGEVTMDFLRQYDALQPFGSGNPIPVFTARGVWLTAAPRKLKNDHLKLFLKQGVHERDAVFFGGGVYDLPEPPWDIAYTIERNVYRGILSVQIHIKDIRSSDTYAR